MWRVKPWLPVAAILLTSQVFVPAVAQIPVPAATAGPAYADLADLSDSAELVVRAQLRKLVRLKDERAPGLRPGTGRFYATAKTQALLAGNSHIGESIAYLVDLPLDQRGKPPSLKKKDVLLFARPVPARPGELQLVAPDAQVLHDDQAEAIVRAILTEKFADGAPGKVTGVREIIHVPGNLAGEGETQVFLSTSDGSAASITVMHRPGRRPAWGASFSELVADVGNPPRANTLAWYRLACFLPNRLPTTANLSATPASRSQAQADYMMVLGELGPCRRNRR